ncbi:MAG TPA: hypothetical protein VHF92_01095 [Geodermatophilus sp.]|nr:hypothetical protein [Geodermatophilus sp.]
MNLVADSVVDTIRIEFLQACTELAEARRARRAQDSPATRSRVQQAQDRVDAVLDMWNEAARR